MIVASRQARRVVRWILSLVEVISVGVVNAVVFFRLGNMELENMPTFLGGTLAFLVAITSLLFNRARAYPSGPVQRRSLLAAELALRAMFLFAFASVLVALIYPMLAEKYATTPWRNMPSNWVPGLVAFVPGFFFLLASLALVEVARVLGPTLVVAMKARHIRRASTPPKLPR